MLDSQWQLVRHSFIYWESFVPDCLMGPLSAGADLRKLEPPLQQAPVQAHRRGSESRPNCDANTCSRSRSPFAPGKKAREADAESEGPTFFFFTKPRQQFWWIQKSVKMSIIYRSDSPNGAIICVKAVCISKQYVFQESIHSNITFHCEKVLVNFQESFIVTVSL